MPVYVSDIAVYKFQLEAYHVDFFSILPIYQEPCARICAKRILYLMRQFEVHVNIS